MSRHSLSKGRVVDAEIANPLLDPVSAEAILSADRNHSNSEHKYLQQIFASSEGSGKLDPADVLAGTYSHHSLLHLDPQTRSRLIMASSFSQRFSFVNPNNSAQLSTFLLLNSMIGSGILNQPYVFRESGILGGILGFLFSTVAIWTGLLCLTAAGIQEECWEYSALAYKAFQKQGERVVDIAIIVLTFGSQLGYILVVGSTLSSLLTSWGCSHELCTNDTYVTFLSICVFVTPICLFRHFGHLAYLSIFSILTIVAVIGLVLIGGPIKHVVDHVPSSNYTIFNPVGLLTSVGSIVFSLDCASSNFQAFISTEGESQNMSSWRIVTRNAVFSGAGMCMIIALVGYLSFHDDTEGEILDNFPQSGYDIFKVMVVIHLILYIPTNFVIMRYSVVKLCLQQRSELLPQNLHTAITIVLLGITVFTVIALLQAGLSNGVAFSLILNITGGIGGKSMCVTL
jgi:sodium-coupled neutral amino acid transporter 11